MLDRVLHHSIIISINGESYRLKDKSDGRNVQIKATFKDSLTFGTIPDYYLGFKLNEDGQFEEIFNGPGKLIYEHFRNRKDLGTKLLSLPTAKLRELSRTVQKRSDS